MTKIVSAGCVIIGTGLGDVIKEFPSDSKFKNDEGFLLLLARWFDFGRVDFHIKDSDDVGVVHLGEDLNLGFCSFIFSESIFAF